MREQKFLRKQRNRVAILWALLTTTAYSGYAQTSTVVYDFPNDVKHYSTEIASDGASAHEAVMGGTIYTSSGVNMAHYLNTDASGLINQSVYFTHSSYDDIRVVDIVGDGAGVNATYYLTCLARPNAGNDRILIIPVDRTGAIPIGKQPWEISVSNSNEALYPLHSIYHTGNNDLYICGYWTDNNTSLPNQPDYSGYGSKMGFVVRTTTNGNVTAATRIETQYTSPGGANSDHDIAMRLKQTMSNDIFVTGGVNNVRPSISSPPEVYHMGTMNVVFNQNLGLINEDHFANTTEVNYFGDEHGIDLIETPAEKYVIGNFINKQGVGSTTFQPNGGFLWVTALDNSFDRQSPLLNSRYRFGGYDYAWALQALTTGATVSFPYDVRFLIAGMESNEWCGTYFSWNDIRPFIFDVSLDFDPTNGISGYFHQWTTYRNQIGTGRKGVDPNSYYDLGGGISNIGWNPTFAARYDNASDIVISGPRWLNGAWPTTDRLSLKRVRADAATHDDASCSGSTAQETNNPPCNQNYMFVDVVDYIGYAGNPVITTYPSLSCSAAAITLSTGSYSYSPETPCTISGGPVYKQSTGVKGASRRVETSLIYPNPASDVVHIDLADKIDGKDIKVVLVNMIGQVAGTLFEGEAKNLRARNTVPLPSVQPGVYQVQIILNDETVYQQKLSVIQ